MREMILENAFDIGDVIYLKTDVEQEARIVTSIIVGPAGLIYDVNCGTESSRHFDFEMTKERDMVTKALGD